MARYGQREVGELVSHVSALRKDFITQLLGSRGIAYSGLGKRELRDRVEQASGDGRIASDSRVHFMVPSSTAGVEYVLGQIRRLL